MFEIWVDSPAPKSNYRDRGLARAGRRVRMKIGQ